MEIRCGACTGDKLTACAKNFETTRHAINDGAEQTMAGGWDEVIIQDDGNVLLRPVTGYSAEAISAQAILRSVFFNSLKTRQDQLDCTLSEELIEQKLSTEERI